MGNEEKKNITIADVAEALGVSKTTVSRAISGKGRIGQETRDRVLKYIEEHDYKPNVIAKGLAQSKTYNLCVVMPGEYDVVDLTFFQECLFGIQEIAGIMEYDILLSICKNNDISSLERIISNRKVDGVILMRTFVEDRQIEYLQEKKVPFVTIGSSNYTGVIQIDHNHKSACKELTSIILMKKNANNIEMKKISAPLVLPSITSAELNYVAFGILSNDYHIELYGYLQQKVAVYLGKSTCSVKECDTYITQQNQFIEALHGKISSHNTTTYSSLSTYIRNAIDHPDPSRTFTEDELRCSIELLIELCR